jgi:hypothetical protein
LKTLGAFTLKVVLSKSRFGSESVSTPMGPRAVTSLGVEGPGDVGWQTLIENWVERGSAPTIVSATSDADYNSQEIAAVPDAGNRGNARKSAAHQSFAISSSFHHRGPAVDDCRTKTQLRENDCQRKCA